jgi:hypothetical protein
MKLKNLNLALAFVVMLTAAGCGDSSPVTPGKEPLIYTGQLASRESNSHTLTLERNGTVSIELTNLRAIFVKVVDPFETVLRIGVGVGSFNDDEVCIPSIRPTFTEGLIRTVLLTRDANCVSVFDNGTLPARAVVAYVVTVRDESAK